MSLWTIRFKAHLGMRWDSPMRFCSWSAEIRLREWQAALTHVLIILNIGSEGAIAEEGQSCDFMRSVTTGFVARIMHWSTSEGGWSQRHDQGTYMTVWEVHSCYRPWHWDKWSIGTQRWYIFYFFPQVMQGHNLNNYFVHHWRIHGVADWVPGENYSIVSEYF